MSFQKGATRKKKRTRYENLQRWSATQMESNVHEENKKALSAEILGGWGLRVALEMGKRKGVGETRDHSVQTGNALMFISQDDSLKGEGNYLSGGDTERDRVGFKKASESSRRGEKISGKDGSLKE